MEVTLKFNIKDMDHLKELIELLVVLHNKSAIEEIMIVECAHE